MNLQVCIALLVALGIHAAQAFDTVVIDAGHGGQDPGSAWTKLVEKDLCLDVAKRLDTVLKARGKHTVMTRDTDSFIELDERARIANQQSDAVFVSIHFNASRSKSIHGYEAHYRSDIAKSLAESIQAAMKKSVPGRSRDSTWQDYKVLRETKCTAVLIECGFISNKDEASDCGSTKHRQKLAEAIADGLLAWQPPTPAAPPQ